MNSLHYTIEINASKEKVWETMLGFETYKQWTAAFHEGSLYEGDWSKGSKIRFLSDEDNRQTGMFGQIVENEPYEFISIEQKGEIVNGQEDTTSESAQNWIGAHENYNFTEKNGVTTVDVELIGLNINDDVAKMFDGMWPQALIKLKAICE